MNLSSASLPCNLSMDKLVESVGPKFIFNYLEKTLDFLTSNAKEFRLPKLLPSKEEFLQRIAKDHAYLLYPVYNEESRKVIDAIKTVLDLNRNVFRWSCRYQNLSNNENCLVYTKQYFLLPTSKISDRLKVRLGPVPTPTNTSTTEIPTTSKLTFLNTTLKFIKDGDRLYLRYPEMPNPVVEYFRKLLESPSMDEEVGPGFKSLYTTLWEAMRIFSLKFEFQITVVATTNGYSCLVLHKVPKCTRTIKQDGRLVESAPKQNQNNQPTSHLTGAKLKKVNQKMQLLENVTASFIDRSLRSLLRFIENEEQFSIAFTNLNHNEAMFYQSVLCMSKSEVLVNLFEDRHKVTLRTIHRMLSTVYRDINVSMMQQRMSGCSEFVVTCHKKLKKKVRQKLQKQQSHLNESSSSLQSTSSKGSVVAKKQQSFLENNSKQAPSVTPRDRSRSSSRASRSKSAINFNSGGTINPNTQQTTDNDKTIDNKIIDNKTIDNKTIDKEKSEKKSEDSVKTISLYSKRHQKIIEDMSVPLECDKATRMMRLMGWEGGALGVRGEGITEPILPSFQIKTGAGLGHTPPTKPADKPKQPKPPKRQKPPRDISLKSSPFRLDFLRYIAKLIIDDCAKMVIKLESVINKKQVVFVREVVDALNDRRKVVLRDITEVGLLMMVTDSMEIRPDLRLSVDISNTKKELTLKKEVIANTKPRQDNMIHQPTLPNLTRQKSIRIIMLERILELLRSNQISKEYHTAWEMTSNDVQCFNELLIWINRRDSMSRDNTAYGVYNEVMSCIGDLDLEFKICSSYTKFVLLKKFSGSHPKYSPNTTEAVNNIKKDCSVEKNVEDDTDEVIYVHIENVVVEISDSDTDDENSKANAIAAKEANKLTTKEANIVAAKEEKDAHKEAEEANNEATEVANNEVTEEANILAEKVVLKEANIVVAENENIVAAEKANTVAEKVVAKEANIVISENANIVTAEEANVVVARADDNTQETSKDKDINYGANKAMTDHNSNLMDIVDNESVNVTDTSEIIDNIELPPTDGTEDVEQETVISNLNENNLNCDIHSTIAKELSKLAMAIKESVTIELNAKNDDIHKANTTKRARSVSNNNNIVTKKPKNDFANLVGISSNDNQMGKFVQMKLYENVDKSPLLQCHGLIAGHLIYACFDQNSLEILETITKELNYNIVDFKTFQTDKIFVVELKMRCYFDFDVFESLKVYCKLNCDKWKVLNKRNVNEFVYIDVEVDGDTVQLISNCNFSMDVGVDRLQFTLLGGRHKSDE